MLSDAHHRYLIPPWNLYKYGTHWFLLVLATIWSLPSKLIKIVIDYAILVVSADLFIKGFNSRKITTLILNVRNYKLDLQRQYIMNPLH